MQANGILTVRIVDDVPTAYADARSLDTKVGILISGNVFESGAVGDVADRIGADTTATPVISVSAGATVGTVGQALSGSYGSLTLNKDGSYNYVLDNTKPAVTQLKSGAHLIETFNYAIADSDGDTSTTTLTITINGSGNVYIGRDDNPVDINPRAVVLTASDGFSTIDIGGMRQAIANVLTDEGLMGIGLGGSKVTLSQLNTLIGGADTVLTSGGTLTLSGYSSASGLLGMSAAGTKQYNDLLARVNESTLGINQTRFEPVDIDSSDSVVGLYLAKTAPSQHSLINQSSTFSIPRGVFRHSDLNEIIRIEASLADGRPLPDWMVFDSDSGRFFVRPPTGSDGVMDIKLTARDQNGNFAETHFLVHISRSKPAQREIPDRDYSGHGTDNNNGSQYLDIKKSPISPHSGLKRDTTIALTGRASLMEQVTMFDHRSKMPLPLHGVYNRLS
jgi:VCBS repeat-containing protein